MRPAKWVIDIIAEDRSWSYHLGADYDLRQVEAIGTETCPPGGTIAIYELATFEEVPDEVA